MLEDANLLEEGFDEGVENRSWGTNIVVDGVKYATSLFWQPMQNSGDYMREVEEASNGILEGADLFCIKGGKASQFGICVSHEGFKTGENVAAVALTTALSNMSSYVAVFKVKEGWWYTCIRNDIILSDGDMLFLTEEEAKNQFLSMMAVPDWDKKIAPKEWGIEDTEEVDVAEILPTGAKVRLQKIHGLRGTKLLLVVGISAVVGIWLVSSLIDKLFMTPVKRPVVVPVKPKITQQAAPIEVPKPWEKIKNPQETLENCYYTISQLTALMPPGWKIGQLNCINGTVATSWVRQIGQLSWIETAIKKSGLPFVGYSFDGAGNNLSASLNTAPIGVLVSPPEKSLVDLRNEINNTFQGLGLTISLAEDVVKSEAPAAASAGPGPKPVVKQQIFKRLKFRFSSVYNPLRWAEMLTKYSGLEVTMINYVPDANVWTYEGAIYVL